MNETNWSPHRKGFPRPSTSEHKLRVTSDSVRFPIIFVAGCLLHLLQPIGQVGHDLNDLLIDEPVIATHSELALADIH